MIPFIGGVVQYRNRQVSAVGFDMSNMVLPVEHEVVDKVEVVFLSSQSPNYFPFWRDQQYTIREAGREEVIAIRGLVDGIYVARQTRTSAIRQRLPQEVFGITYI